MACDNRLMGLPFRAVVFDFDGLIVDTEQPIFNAYTAIFEEYGLVLSLEIWEQVIGGTGHRDILFEHLEHALGRPVDRDALRERARTHHHNVTVTLPPLDGVVDHIEQARAAGMRLGIASSSTGTWVKGHLERLGLLERFDTICVREDVDRTKPDPDVYELAMMRLNVEPNESIAIEDSPNGITAAKRAGLFCVAVPNPLTLRMKLDHADLLLGSLSEMTHAEIVRALAS